MITVPETFYFPTWTVSVGMVNKQWMYPEWKLCEHIMEFGEGYVNDEWTLNMNGSQTREQSERRMQDEWSIWRALYVF